MKSIAACPSLVWLLQPKCLRKPKPRSDMRFFCSRPEGRFAMLLSASKTFLFIKLCVLFFPSIYVPPSMLFLPVHSPTPPSLLPLTSEKQMPPSTYDARYFIILDAQSFQKLQFLFPGSRRPSFLVDVNERLPTTVTKMSPYAVFIRPIPS